MAAKFQKGDLAQIKLTGEVVTINAISPGIKQIFYIVFHNGKKNRYKESELIPYVDKETEILLDLQNNQLENAEAFQKYAYYRMFSESREENLFSYQGNKIIFNPFQYKPLMKFLSIESDERLLIADEVGVGKTIESGIILDELISRGELKVNDPVLIVCPSVLCRKWKSELQSKFMIDDFYIHDGKSLEYLLTSYLDTGRIQYAHSIVSEQLFRGDKYLDLLKLSIESADESIFKLLIIDECHHYRNPGTSTHKIGRLLSILSERVLMLSATPFNLRSDDLYNQLHMLNPMLFPEKQVFEQMLPQIRNVNQAISCLKGNGLHSNEMLISFVKKLKPIADRNEFISEEYDRLYNKILSDKMLSVKEKVDFERIIGVLNPIATSFTRTLKRDAIEHRVTRKTMTMPVQFSPMEEDIYRSFLEVNLQRYHLLGISERTFGLILNGLERIAASSIIALEKNINRFIRMSDEAFADMLSEDYGIDLNSAKAMKRLLQESYSQLMSKIRAIGDRDSKYLVFKELIEEIERASIENKRIIVFSFYTETLKYLRRRLSSDGYQVALMYGKTPSDTPKDQVDEDGFKIYGREDIMRGFEHGEYEILLVSEVGGEGLDFQFCSSLINYDLPYNPMRIEQRIGRIDRMGQEADKILIGNLCVMNTIDEVINRVLLARIADATDLVGELEPIIANELEEINRKIITREFTKEEIHKREIELEQRIEKARQTREEFDEARYELVNDKGFRSEFEDSINKSRILPEESLLFTYSFLKKENGCWCRLISSTAAYMHITKDICDRIRVYVKKMNLGKAGEELYCLVEKGGNLEIEFDGNSAYKHKERTFFKPAGAWIHFIIDYIRGLEIERLKNVFYSVLKKGTVENIGRGRYWLFVYDMEFIGFNKTRTYEYILSNSTGSKVICLEEEQKKCLLKELKNGKIDEEICFEDFDDIQMSVEAAMEQRKEIFAIQAKGRNDIKIGSRIQAIKNLSKIRIRNIENDLIGASEKEEEKLRKRIIREKKKAEEKISILENKLKFVGTYALDAICLIDVV